MLNWKGMGRVKVLHIDTGREWRGGQRQALFLHEGLLGKGIESRLLCNSEGQLYQREFDGKTGLPFHGELNPVFVRQVLRMVRDEQFDIIHSHDAHALTPTLFVKMFYKDVRLVHTRRVDFSVNKNRFSRLKYTNKWVDSVVAISKAVKNVLVEDGLDADAVPLINSGVRFPEHVEMSAIEQTASELGVSGFKVIGNISNFADHKDHKTLIRAFDALCQSRSDVKLLLVGDGPLYDEIVEFSRTLACFDRIVFTGHRDDVYELMHIMDLFSLTSTTEGLGTTIIDALYMGLPVVATRAGGIPELVQDGENGFLAEIKDVSAITGFFEKLLEDTALRNRLSGNARNSAENFSDKRMVEQYIALYEQVLAV